MNPTLNDWDEHLDAAEFAVNNAWQESIRTTPFFLNYGLRPHTPSEVELPSRVPAAASFQRMAAHSVGGTAIFGWGGAASCC